MRFNASISAAALARMPIVSDAQSPQPWRVRIRNALRSVLAAGGPAGAESRPGRTLRTSLVVRTLAVAAAGVTSIGSHAEPAAATSCPPYGFVNHPNNAVNLAKNPSFERCIGPQTTYGSFTPSAAADWVMHSDNYNAKVFSECVVTHAPGPNGEKMLRFVAGGGEGGVIQFMASPPPKVMFSAWVFVKKGLVQIQPHGGAGGPVAHSTKRGEWEHCVSAATAASPQTPTSS
jgi:hypothetical protein